MRTGLLSQELSILGNRRTVFLSISLPLFFLTHLESSFSLATHSINWPLSRPAFHLANISLFHKPIISLSPPWNGTSTYTVRICLRIFFSPLSVNLNLIRKNVTLPARPSTWRMHGWMDISRMKRERERERERKQLNFCTSTLRCLAHVRRGQDESFFPLSFSFLSILSLSLSSWLLEGRLDGRIGSLTIHLGFQESFSQDTFNEICESRLE